MDYPENLAVDLITFTVPFLVVLMILRHMFRDSTVLPFASMQPSVRGNPLLLIENLYSRVGYSDVNILAD